MERARSPARSVPFRVALWLGPLAAAVHNAEEYPGIVAYGQRHLSELVGVAFPGERQLLPAIVLANVLPFLAAALAVSSPSGSARWLPFFTIQAAIFANAFSHLAQTVLFMDYSPGTATGLLLSIPVNAYLFRRAYRERVVSGGRLAAAAVIGVIGMVPAILGLQYLGRVIAGRP